MKVFVTGGTGAVGSHAVPALVRAGHSVTALARTPEKAATLRAQGATPVTVSLFDRAGLAKEFTGHDAVVNLATAQPSITQFLRASAWRETTRIRTKGSATVVDAALDAGVGRLVQESVAMLYPDRGDRWIDESVPVDPYPIARGNLAAEASARRFTEAGGGGVVLRFGLFYGPGARHSEQMLGLARHHVCTAIGPPGSYTPLIHMADAGAAVAHALDVPAGTYNVVDDEPLTTRDSAAALETAAGARAWLRVPGKAALLFGNRVASLTRSLRVSNARFRDATAWAPRYPSAREGWAATASALRG
ncbi:MAG: NAD(P)H-binding protein [Actinophytocola sp.]|nr:NAD(P)H-binding protein [Actinophytocola sp.]